MTDTTALDETVPKRARSKILLPVMAILMAGAGFFSTYTGLLSLPAVAITPMSPAGEPSEEVAFIDMPRLTVPLAGLQQTLALALKLEVTAENAAQVEHFMPRLTDSFYTFLSEIDPAAFRRRGVLEVIREELAARVVIVLGDGLVNDILVTEFAVQ